MFYLSKTGKGIELLKTDLLMGKTEVNLSIPVLMAVNYFG